MKGWLGLCRCHVQYKENTKLQLPITSLTSQMKTSIILNAAFKGNTDAQSVKNQAEAYIAVSNPWKQVTRDEKYM